MTDTEWVFCPDPVMCHRCRVEQPANFPVALIGAWNGGHWYACAPCVREVEGVAQ